MKRKVFIFRFGTPMPTPKEFGIIDEITGNTRRATGMGTPFGMLSIVETSLSPAEIVSIFDRVADENGDALPTIVFEESDKVSFNFHPEFFGDFEACNRAFDEEFGTSSTQCTLSLDELLDLVKSKGLSKFTEAELKRLKELSK